MKISASRTSQLSDCILYAFVLSFGLSSSAWGYVYSTQYEMNTPPSESAGVIDANNTDYNGNGVMTVGLAGSGATFINGIMEYIDDSSSGNYGYYFAAANQVTSFTIDLSVKVASGVSPNSFSRSMGFSGGPPAGNVGRDRALRLNTGSVQFANGVSGVGTAGSIDLVSGFVALRVTYNSETNIYSIFDLEGGGSLTSVPAGGSGPANQINEHGGWHIGALAGTGTTDTHFYLDYFRILIGTAVEDSTTEIAQIPEPAMFSLLFIGCLLLQRRLRVCPPSARHVETSQRTMRLD